MAYRRRTSRYSSRARRPARRSGYPRTSIRRRRRSSMGYRKKNVLTRDKPCVCPGPLTPSHKFVLAQLDPFDPVVQGAKVPDSNSIPSIAHCDTDIVALPATANTLAAFAFRPNYTAGVIVAEVGATAVQWPTDAQINTSAVQNRSKREQYIAQIELTRPVSHAVRITSSIAPTTATGFVHIGLATEALIATGTSPNYRVDYPLNPAEMAGLQHYKRVTLASLTQSPVTIINKWLDDTGFRYSAAKTRWNVGESSTAGAISPREFQTDYGWAAIIVMIEGAPTTGGTSLSAEHLLMSEAIPQRNAVLLGNPAAPNNPGAMSAANAVTTQMEPVHTEAEQESYISKGISLGAEGAAAAGRQAFDQIGAPLLQRVGYHVAARAMNMAAAAIGGRGGLPGINSNPERLALN